MNNREYITIMESLKKKLHKGQLTNEQKGYNDGIKAAMSKVRQVHYNRTDEENDMWDEDETDW